MKNKMKNIFVAYYEHRLHRLVEAQQDLSRYWCLHSSSYTVISNSLEFHVKWQELLLEIYKSFLSKKWIKK